MSGQFIIVRSDALDDPELLKAPTLFMTLCAISTMTSQNKGGWCFFKQETIAKRLGKSRQAISKSLNKLKELGYLEIQQQSYKGRQSNNLYRLTYDGDALTVQRDVAPMPQCEVAPSAQRDVAPKRPEYIKDIKIKNALTRDEFLREIDWFYSNGEFNPEFEHLTETEIMSEARACYDWMVAELKDPEEGKCGIHLRVWLRKGIRSGAIRKAKSQGLSNGEQVAEPENPLQPWHERIRPKVGDAVFIAWIRPLHHDGNGTLQAPSKFIADWVNKNYRDEINSVLRGVEIKHQPFQPTKEKEAVHA